MMTMGRSGLLICCGITADDHVHSPVFVSKNGMRRLASLLGRGRPYTVSISLRRMSGKRETMLIVLPTNADGSELDLVEAPHLYKRNGYYYLLTAEGGTSYHHACTLARSKGSIWGPYEEHPDVHILTSKDHPNAAIQRAGHGDFVETPDGKCYLVHLMGRPVTQRHRCVLGRECGLQEAEWRDDDWLYVKDGPVPSLYVSVPGTFDEAKYWSEQRYTFEKELHQDFQWLRTPETNRIFAVKDGKLELYGRESIGSWFEQSLVARRQTHFSFYAETVLDFSPQDERQFAGITGYYCRYNFFYLTVTANADGKRELLLMSSENSYPEGKLNHFDTHVSIPQEGKVKLAMRIWGGYKLQFYYAMDGEDQLKKFGPVLDASILSDECGGHQADGSFTGAFTGMAASDCNGEALTAKFDYFLYRPEHSDLDRYDVSAGPRSVPQ
jgi:xylan 1,4-beta-xylosidase